MKQKRHMIRLSNELHTKLTKIKFFIAATTGEVLTHDETLSKLLRMDATEKKKLLDKVGIEKF